MLRITAQIRLHEDELELKAVRSPGPGGQNVNKVATAIQLRFDVRNAAALPAEVRDRLERLAGSRLSNDGVLTLTARRHRTQEANRRDAIERLVQLVRRAAQAPKPRRPTRAPRSVERRRLEQKRQRGAVKKSRRRPAED